MRSWVFRNRARLEALARRGSAPAAPETSPAKPAAAAPRPAWAGPQARSLRPRPPRRVRLPVVELVPLKRRVHDTSG